jgi:hypothetical protein
MQQMREQERPPTPLVVEGTREKQGMSAGLNKPSTTPDCRGSLLGQQQQSETLSHELLKRGDVTSRYEVNLKAF